MKVVTYSSIKGGVGKSSIAAMTANCLAASGKKVLVIDMDVNNSMSFYYLDKKGAEQYVSTKHLHDLLLSMHIAFKSYHDIKRYASRLNKKIYNITKGSFIDAFERKILD